MSGPNRPSPVVHARTALKSAQGELPHLETIQRSFGRHDLRRVRALIDPAAAQPLGAQAFASGRSICFARTPDLFTAAHEAVHTLQAAAPASGELVAADHAHERLADQVAERVVHGDSAEQLLDEHIQAGEPPDHAPIYRKIGFEFETFWDLEWKEVTDGGASYVKVASKDEKATHQDQGWKAESDCGSPEYIVEPAVDNVAEARARAEDCARFAEGLRAQFARLAPDEKKRYRAVNLGWQAAGVGGKELVIRPWKDSPQAAIFAETQCTIGIDLDKFEAMFKFFADPKGEAARLAGQEPLPDALVQDSTASAYERPGRSRLKRDRTEPDRSTLDVLAVQKTLVEPAAAAREAVQQIVDQVPSQSPKLRGFLTLIAFYLRCAADYHEVLAYPKIAFTLMDRSDFRRLFLQLEKTNRLWFVRALGIDGRLAQRSVVERTPVLAPPRPPTNDEMFDNGHSPEPTATEVEGRLFGRGGLLEALGFDPRQPMFPGGYETPYERDDDDQEYKISHGPTGRDWLRSIPFGYRAEDGQWVDADKLSPPPGWPDRNQRVDGFPHAMGSFHNLEQEGMAMRAIAELRTFGRKITSDKWADHAESMARLVKLVTGSLGDGRRPAGDDQDMGEGAPAPIPQSMGE